jgi:hypothetical protein
MRVLTIVMIGRLWGTSDFRGCRAVLKDEIADVIRSTSFLSPPCGGHHVRRTPGLSDRYLASLAWSILGDARDRPFD